MHALNAAPNSVPMPPLTGHLSNNPSPPLTPPSAMPATMTRKAMLASMIASTLGACIPSARAENVRLRDVQSPALQAGLRAATEGRWADAERLFQVVLAEEPELASVWSNIGNVHLEQGRLQDALRDYSRAVELAPKAPVPYVNRALAHESLALQAKERPVFQRELQAALDDLSTAIALDPTEFTAYFNRGNVYLRLQDFDAASSSFTAAADLAPGIAGYRLRAATLYYQTGNTARALSTVRGVLRKNPRYPEAHLVMAAMLWEDGDRAAAEEEYALATSLDGEFGAGMDNVRRLTLWPPKLYEALARFQSFSIGPAEVK